MLLGGLVVGCNLHFASFLGARTYTTVRATLCVFFASSGQTGGTESCSDQLHARIELHA